MWGKLGNRKFVAKRWNEGTLKRAAVKLGDKRAEVRWEEAVRNILTVWHPHDILNNFHFDTCSIVILPIVVSDSLFERQGHLAPIKSKVFWFPNWNTLPIPSVLKSHSHTFYLSTLSTTVSLYHSHFFTLSTCWTCCSWMVLLPKQRIFCWLTGRHFRNLWATKMANHNGKKHCHIRL